MTVTLRILQETNTGNLLFLLSCYFHFRGKQEVLANALTEPTYLLGPAKHSIKYLTSATSSWPMKYKQTGQFKNI